jgi:uncharacterized protein YjbI with pentapeptide repeats
MQRKSQTSRVCLICRVLFCRSRAALTTRTPLFAVPFFPVLAKKTTFAGSNLQGCRFYKAYLVQADFTGADMRGASLEDTSMDEADLQNVVAAGAYFSRSILDVKNLANIDLTDAQVPVKALPMLCDRSDLKGTNPVTGVDTRESIMCP